MFALDGPVEFRLEQFYLEPILVWVSVRVFVDWIDKPRAGSGPRPDRVGIWPAVVETDGGAVSECMGVYAAETCAGSV
jgi:hypothetical protein